MNTLMSVLVMLLTSGMAQAGTNMCQQGIESLAKARRIPFQFEPGTERMRGADSFDTSRNPKVYTSKGGVTLQVFEKHQQTIKYVVTHAKNCAKYCDHLSLEFEVDFPNGECRLQRAQVHDDLNERTLWTRPICEEIQKSRHLYEFLSKHGEWISEFRIQRKKFQDPLMLLRQIKSNCQKYESFYEAGGLAPAGRSVTPAGGAQ